MFSDRLRNLYAVRLFAALALLLVAAGCGGSSPGGAGNAGSTSLSLIWPDKPVKSAGVFSAQAIPSDVDSIILTVSASGMTTVTTSFDLVTETAQVTVLDGLSRLFEVEAFPLNSSTPGYVGSAVSDVTSAGLSLTIQMSAFSGFQNQVSGQAFKGPFIKGSTVTAFKLSSAGAHTGTTASSTVTDDLGRYVINIPWADATEIVITGRYFDELTGTIKGPETVSTVVNLPAISASGNTLITVNPNVITSIVAALVKTRLASGIAIGTALADANQLVLLALGLPTTDALGNPINPADLDITNTADTVLGEANRKLLVLSVAFADAIANGAAADLKTLLDSFAVDIAAGNLLGTSSGATSQIDASLSTVASNIATIVTNLNNLISGLFGTPDTSLSSTLLQAVTEIQNNIITAFKGFAIASNQLTATTGSQVWTINSSGGTIVTGSAAIASDVAITATLIDYTGMANPKAFTAALSLYIASTATSEAISAKLSPVNINVDAFNGAIISVPTGATLAFTGTTAAGTVITDTATGVVADQLITTVTGAVFNINITNFISAIVTKTSNSSLDIFASAGTFNFELGFGGINIGHENSGMSNVDSFFQLGTNVTGRAVSGTLVTTGGATGAVSGLTQSVAASQSVSLSWSAVTGADSYKVYRGTAPGVNTGGTLVGSGITSTSFTDTGLTPGAVYYYVVTAVNVVGESTISNEASALAQGTSGSLDKTFAFQGYTITDFSASTADEAYGLTFDSSGRIIVVGEIVGASSTDFGIVRLLSDGQLDTAFGTGGRVQANFGPSYPHSHAHEVLIDANGKIVIAGIADSTGSLKDWALTRYDTNGVLDTTFGTGGVTVLDVGGDYDKPWDMEIDSSGNIIVAGQSRNQAGGGDFAVARFSSSGILDTAFGASGIALINIQAEDFGFGLAIDSSGRILVSGDTAPSFTSGVSDLAVARLTSNGTLDSTFGAGGKVITDVGSGTDDFGEGRLAIDSSGKIIVAGLTIPGSFAADFALVRYNSDGTLDTTFGTGGKVTTDFNGTSDWAHDIAIDPNGKIIIGGFTSDVSTGKSDLSLARYNSDGSLDTTFSGDGLVTTHVDTNHLLNRMMIDPYGRVVVVGMRTDSIGDDSFLIARYWNHSGASGQTSTRTTTFSTADLAGTWYGHSLKSGLATPMNGQWVWEKITVDSSGVPTLVTGQASDSSPVTVPQNFHINVSGELSEYDPGVHGWMSLDKNLMVLVERNDVNKYKLRTFVRGGGTFVSTDIAASGVAHNLAGNPSSAYWAYFNDAVTSGGTETRSGYADSFDSNVLNIGGPTATVSLSSSGVVSESGDTSRHAIRSLDNLLEIGTHTGFASDGSVANLYITPATGGTYVTSDLAGTWHVLEFDAGSSSAGWRKSTQVVDSSGLITGGSAGVNEDGTIPAISSGIYSVDTLGVVTFNTDSTFHGVMSKDKSLIIGTRTPGATGTGGLVVLMK